MQKQKGLLPQSVFSRIRKIFLGPARDLHDQSIRHKVSLIAFLAWVGLGSDSLSSSAYGPEEAFRALGQHIYLAIPLALATAATVFIISYAYRGIIERFPFGGGGYLVATELLGSSAGVVSGCALLVDYVLTITVSIASGGDALFSLMPLSFQRYKLFVEFGAILFLIVINLRGVKESISILIPIFVIFIATHLVLILGGLISHGSELGTVLKNTKEGFDTGITQVGAWGLFLIFLRSYSLGSGTYTGIEAVSNGLGILREPRVETGKKTMTYMALSLAFTAGGLLLCYMFLNVKPVVGKTLNAVLAENFFSGWHLGSFSVAPMIVLITIGVEAILLLVAAQTGFIDGPRVMANMAQDAWLPRRFSSLSDRLTMQNGILVMGIGSLIILVLTRGQIGFLVVMYSINVFLTFSLSQLGMVRFWIKNRRTEPRWKRDLIINGVGFILCSFILLVMVVEKISEGAWMTVLITGMTLGVCFLIRDHYNRMALKIREIDHAFSDLPMTGDPARALDFDSQKPTAIILVGGYSGLGKHIFLNIFRLFPNAFKNVIFLSVGVVDSNFFKNPTHIEALTQKTQVMLDQYVEFSRRLGIPARSIFRIGTEVVESVSELCIEVAKNYSHCVFFGGELVFEKPQWYHRILHNETAYAIQRQIRFTGLPMVILPIRIRKK